MNIDVRFITNYMTVISADGSGQSETATSTTVKKTTRKYGA